MTTLNKPPGPKGLPIVGSLFAFMKDYIGFLRSVAKTYGDFAYFELAGRKIYLINNPEFIKDILITNNRNFSKSKVLKRSKIVVGEGLLTSEGETHLKNRRLIQPLFHNKAIPNYADLMVSETKKFIDKWENDSVIDLHNEMMKITQTIVVKSLFGTDLGNKTQELIKSLNFIMNMFPRLLMPFSEILDYLPLPSTIRFKKELKNIDNIIFELIEKRKNNYENKYDLLSILLSSKDEKGNSYFTPNQIRDEVITFFIAGQETTSNSLCWAWYLISQNPEQRKNLYKEVEEVLGKNVPKIDDINKLKYVNNCFKEALRMYPPAWVVSRRVLNDYQLNGYTIPAGADIYMSQFVVHYDNKFYEEPDDFNPDRWEDENLPRFAYFPFGGGTRRCIGEPFAIMEAVLIIALVAQNFELELEPGFIVEMQPLITIRPKYGMNMIVKKR